MKHFIMKKIIKNLKKKVITKILISNIDIFARRAEDSGLTKPIINLLLRNDKPNCHPNENKKTSTLTKKIVCFLTL